MAILIETFLTLIVFALLIFTIYLILKQKMEMDSFSNDFAQILNEAEQMKQDLSNMMENALTISRSLVDNLDSKVNISASNEEQITGSEYAFTLKDKISLNELEEQLDINNQEILSLLADWGYKYNDLNELEEQLDINNQEILTLLVDWGYKYNAETNSLDIDIVQNTKKKMNENVVGDKPDITETGAETVMLLKDDGDDLSIESLKEAHPYLAVSMLSQKGHSIKEIAKLLGRGQGEISLMLNLLKKSKAI